MLGIIITPIIWIITAAIKIWWFMIKAILKMLQTMFKFAPVHAISTYLLSLYLIFFIYQNNWNLKTVFEIKYLGNYYQSALKIYNQTYTLATALLNSYLQNKSMPVIITVSLLLAAAVYFGQYLFAFLFYSLLFPFGWILQIVGWAIKGIYDAVFGKNGNETESETENDMSKIKRNFGKDTEKVKKHLFSIQKNKIEKVKAEIVSDNNEKDKDYMRTGRYSYREMAEKMRNN